MKEQESISKKLKTTKNKNIKNLVYILKFSKRSGRLTIIYPQWKNFVYYET